MEPEIVRITRLTEPLQDALARLLPQLSPRLTGPAPERLQTLLASDRAVLLAALSEGRIAGVLTLVWYDTPSTRKAWIEDVVVDSAARGCGAGEMLVRAAIERAAAEGVEQICLTSAAHRKAARALYRKMGFEEADTSVFALNINSQE